MYSIYFTPFPCKKETFSRTEFFKSLRQHFRLDCHISEPLLPSSIKRENKARRLASFQLGTFSSHNKRGGGGGGEEQKLHRIVPFHLAKTRDPLIYRSLLLPIHRASCHPFLVEEKTINEGRSSRRFVQLT